MGAIFKSDFHDGFGTWPLGYIPYGGADFGEVEAVAKAIGDGGDEAFYDANVAAGDRFAAEAHAVLAKGRRRSASELFLRSSVFYGASYHPIYGEPVDPRLLAAFRKQIAAFDQGLTLLDEPVRRLTIPFEDASMPAYLIPAAGHANEVRPLLICTNGYDGTVTDLYYMIAVAASRRGYHSLIFDGPGQGAMLYEQGVRMRPDWETVIRAVVDVAMTQPNVDQKRVALNGVSLGGYLAPRGAAGEPRIAALIADPGLWSVAGGFRPFATKAGATAEQAANLGELDTHLIEKLEHIVASDRRMTWAINQRGFWVHGVKNLRDYFAAVEAFTMEGRSDMIRCPTLLTRAEDDTLSYSARSFYTALKCPKDLLTFGSAEGAGMHCEMWNRSLVNRRVFDWLDDRFAMKG